MKEKYSTFKKLTQAVVACRLCERLVHFRENVPPRPLYCNQLYWRKPVPGYGDPQAWLLILGLAPAAHGGNRTGRIFTGDASARFLMRVLFREGFANQPTSESKDDGLILTGCYLTAAVKCVPPQDKPTRIECQNCSRYLLAELHLLKNLKAVLALGKFAFDAYLMLAREMGYDCKKLSFAHDAYYKIGELPPLYVSYHPSPHNTYTKRLTEGMMSTILNRMKQDQQQGKA
jgi:uracil-DNA glycosylase